MGGFVRDPIYGMIEIHPLCEKIIRLPEFQRLHDLKQLGCLYYTYPGATHDRFQHCIGVYHLAEMFINHLQKAQPELEITEQEKLAVCIGGLVHDLGHVMLCHMYPRYVQYCKNELPLSHEIMSVLIFRSVIQKWGLAKDFLEYGMDENCIQLICDIILGSKDKGCPEFPWIGAPGREFLLQIVANARSGIDVDRFDYMVRDCYHLGLHCSYNYDNILLRSRCIKNEHDQWEICFNHKVFYDVCDMFQCRLNLCRRAYLHPSCRIIERMLIEAFQIAEEQGVGIQTANGTVKLSELIRSPADYIQALKEDRLDSLLEPYLKATDYFILQLKNSVEPGLEAARRLIQRIEMHDYYPFVGRILVTNQENGDDYENLTYDDLINGQLSFRNTRKLIVKIKELLTLKAEEMNIPFDPETLFIDACKMDMGSKGKNPLPPISFFSDSNPDKQIKMVLEKGRVLGSYVDYKLFFYSRGDKSTVEAFQKLLAIGSTLCSSCNDN